MADVTTSLGLETSAAIQALAKLELEIAKYNQSLRTSQQAMQAFNAKGTQFDAALNKNATAAATARLQLAKLQQSQKNIISNQTLSNLGNATEKVGVFGKALSRIGTIASGLIIFQLISRVAGAFSNAVSGAREFEIQLAEIQTISEDLASRSLGEVGDLVADLSVKFQEPINEVAEALYQTLSSQIGSTAESVRFLTASLTFGNAALVQAGDSTKLLAGIINAYGKEAAAATEISDKLFKTIELGQVRGSELANSLGRVIPTAAQLGISLNELLASVAGITIQGVDAADATTQLQNVMLKLIRPSDDLKDRFRELGFASAEVAIAAEGGLVPALEKITESTDGSATAFGKYFPRVRALRGVLSLLNDDSEKVANALKEIQTASEGASAAAFQLIRETDAGQLQLEFEKFNAFMVNEFGRDVVGILNSAIQAIGGLQAVIDVFREHGIAAFSPVIVLIRELAGIERAIDPIARLNQELAKSAEEFEQINALQTRIVTSNINDRITEIRQLVATELQGIAKIQAADTRQQAQSIQLFEQQFNVKGTTVANFITKIESAIANADKEISRLGASLDKFVGGAKDRQFERGLKDLDPAAEARKREERARKFLRDAQKATRAGNAKEAEDFFNRALKQAEAVANLLEGRRRSEDFVNTIIRARQKSVKTLISIETREEGILKRLLVLETQRNKRIAARAKLQQLNVDIGNQAVKAAEAEIAIPGLRTDADINLERVTKPFELVADAIREGSGVVEAARRVVENEIAAAGPLGGLAFLQNRLASSEQQLAGLKAEENAALGRIAQLRGDVQRAIAEGSAEQLQAATEGLKNLKIEVEADPVAVEAISKILESLGPAATAQLLLNTATAAAAQNEAALVTLRNQEKTATDNLTASLNKATIAQNALNVAAAGGGGSQSQAVGGIIYRQGGGNVGTDTINAKLSPGEGVLSVDAMKQFFPQFIAANRGANPRFGEGGAVTNVGDININVSGVDKPVATGREVVTAIKRELRRGTSEF